LGISDNDSYDLLKFIVISSKRRNILVLLEEGPKTLQEIKKFLKADSPAVIPYLRQLEKNKLIFRSNGEYSLTDIGSIIAKQIKGIDGSLKVFKRNMDFWIDHDLSGIPDELITTIYEIGDYEIVSSTPVDILKPHREFINLLLNSRWIKGVCPIYFSDYPGTILELLKKGAEISLIITDDVFTKILENNSGELAEAKKFPNYNLKICNNKIRIAFAVTDNFLSLGMFLKNGAYDFHSNIISHDRSAITFGERLFDYFQKYITE